MIAVDESQEMDLLRLENDVLRRKLATLEKTVQDLEQDSEFRRHDMPDIEKLSTLLLKAKVCYLYFFSCLVLCVSIGRQNRSTQV